jgi:predicted ATPase/DNA-binding SARP family transcriptional activator
MFRLCLLGAFQVQMDGQPVAGFASNKVRALLAYLAVESDHPHSRETLMGLLWPDWPQSSAQGNLRYALSNLRKLLKPVANDLLTISRQDVQFHFTDQVWVDVAVFQRLLGNNPNGPPVLGSLEEGIALYRGEFLEGLTISDSSLFEEWRTVRREQYLRQVLDTLHIMAEHHITRGEYNQALHHAWRQLELEPWSEGAHQQVMCALAFSGQRDVALAQYKRCLQILEQELDIEPSTETKKLFEDIRDGKLIKAAVIGNGEKRIISSNLPTLLTSFIGRQREVAEITRLFSSTSMVGSKPPVRLLTLTGAGGCGKTRLAIESAQRMATADCFPNGVWWVDLARLSAPHLVAPTVATVLGLCESLDMPIVTSLTNYLRTKQTLILLDNCEHLIDDCAQLAETLLLACPQLRIIATSREALDLDGECIFQVNPLPFPDPANPPPLEKLQDYEAVRLFVERGETILPGFSLTQENAPTVIHICRQLDGIPLAIELAARQLKALAVGQIAAKLDDRFILLTNGYRTALPHHHTLRGVLDWSYDFLSHAERSLFCQLSIFSGGWTLESAAQITTGGTLDLLTALVDKSLVIIEQTESTVRYRMLETIRQYGREKLAEAGQEELLRSRYMEFFLQFAERSWKEMRGGDQKLWLKKTQAEYDNIRMALNWSLGSGKRPEVGLRLAIAMSEFWNWSNYYREEHQWLEHALALADETCSPRLRGWANAKLAYCTFYLGDFETMQSCVDLAWEIFANLEDTEGIAAVLQGRAALAAIQKGEAATAQDLLEESLKLLRSIDDKWELAETLRDLGHTFYLQKDLDKARSCLNEAEQLCRETSNTWQLVQTLYHLGMVAHEAGDYSSARSYFEESRQKAKENDIRDNDADVLSALGELARCEGDFQQARIFYEEGLLLDRDAGAEYSAAFFLRCLGYTALHFADYHRATELFNESLQYWQKYNVRSRMIGCYAGLAGVAAALGEMERAAWLLGKADALLEETGIIWSARDPNRVVYDHTVFVTRTNLGEERYKFTWKEGYDSSHLPG